eukprot:9503338-Pyramimonas_sp.AAC.1
MALGGKRCPDDLHAVIGVQEVPVAEKPDGLEEGVQLRVADVIEGEGLDAGEVGLADVKVVDGVGDPTVVGRADCQSDNTFLREHFTV